LVINATFNNLSLFPDWYCVWWNISGYYRHRSNISMLYKSVVIVQTFVICFVLLADQIITLKRNNAADQIITLKRNNVNVNIRKRRKTLKHSRYDQG
jgi:uncharacterized membrane protein